eukprot:g2312.t1
MSVLSVTTCVQLIVLFVLVKIVFRHLFSPLAFATRGLLFWVPLVEKLGGGGGSTKRGGSGGASQGLRNRKKKNRKQSGGSASSASSFPIGLRQRELTEKELVELSYATEVDWIMQSVVCAVTLFLCAQVTSCVSAQTPHVNVAVVSLTIALLLCVLFLLRDLMFSGWSTVRQHAAVFMVSFVLLMFSMQLPASLLDLHIREAVPILRGRFLNVKFSLNQNASMASTGTDSRHDSIEAAKNAARFGSETYDDVTDVEWMFACSCFAFIGASIAALMLKPARLSAKVFRHATTEDNVRRNGCLMQAAMYIGFFMPVLLVVCWIPPLTIDFFRPAVDDSAWQSLRTGAVICGSVYSLATTRFQVQMHLDGIRPEFANLSTIKGKLSAAKLIEFVMHRVRSVCPVVLALISIGVIPMCLAMILKDVAGIAFVEVGGLRVCPTSIAKDAIAAAEAKDPISGGTQGTSALVIQKVLSSLFDEEQMARLEIIWSSSSIGFVMQPILEPFVSFLLFVVTGSTCMLGMLEAVTIS